MLQFYDFSLVLAKNKSFFQHLLFQKCNKFRLPIRFNFVVIINDSEMILKLVEISFGHQITIFTATPSMKPS